MDSLRINNIGVVTQKFGRKIGMRILGGIYNATQELGESSNIIKQIEIQAYPNPESPKGIRIALTLTDQLAEIGLVGTFTTDTVVDLETESDKKDAKVTARTKTLQCFQKTVAERIPILRNSLKVLEDIDRKMGSA